MQLLFSVFSARKRSRRFPFANKHSNKLVAYVSVSFRRTWSHSKIRGQLSIHAYAMRFTKYVTCICSTVKIEWRQVHMHQYCEYIVHIYVII